METMQPSNLMNPPEPSTTIREFLKVKFTFPTVKSDAVSVGNGIGRFGQLL